jgi:hypothetical protein
MALVALTEKQWRDDLSNKACRFQRGRTCKCGQVLGDMVRSIEYAGRFGLFSPPKTSLTRTMLLANVSLLRGLNHYQVSKSRGTVHSLPLLV